MVDFIVFNFDGVSEVDVFYYGFKYIWLGVWVVERGFRGRRNNCRFVCYLYEYGN